MKIVCLINSLGLGGAARQMVGLATALAREGHEVEIITYHHNKKDFYSDALKGIRQVKMSRRGGCFALVKRINKHLKEQGCDVLISFLAGTNIKACLVHRRWPDFRLIVSERNHNEAMYLHDKLRFLLYRQADDIVCNNYSQEAFIKAHSPRLTSKVCTIPNFVDTDKFAPTARDAEDTSPMRIVVTARLCKRKNALGLIRAASIMRNVGRKFSIDWYGLQKEDSYYRSCINLIATCGLQDCFHIHPATRDVAEVYAKSDVFCLPSFYEGTSNSLAEALACGLPAVCSDKGDNTRYVHNGVNGFVFNPRRPESIALALEKAISLNRGPLAELGEVSRQLVCQELSGEAFRKHWLELLNK